MINAHKRNKDYYGGETMPEGTQDCNSCGWHGLTKYFRYGLCNSCGDESWWNPDIEEDINIDPQYNQQ